MKKVSVIVPVYNVEKYLRRCLDSILKQTYTNFELICINDCSPDRSQLILEEYKEKYYDVVRILKNEANLGLGMTREKGISVATGEYIMFVDSDDFVEQNWIEKYVTELEKQEELDMVIGGYTNASEKKKVPHVTQNNKYSIFMHPSACTRIYKKIFLEKNNINFGGLRRSEDNYWSIMIALANPNYKIIDDVGYYYWENLESITRGLQRNDNHVEEELEILHSTIYRNLNFAKMTEFQKQMVEYLFISNTFIWLFFYNRKCGIKRMKTKYDYMVKNLEKYFPSFYNNALVGFGKFKEGSFFSRNFISMEVLLYRCKIGYLLYFFRAIL